MLRDIGCFLRSVNIKLITLTLPRSVLDHHLEFEIDRVVRIRFPL